MKILNFLILVIVFLSGFLISESIQDEEYLTTASLPNVTETTTTESGSNSTESSSISSNSTESGPISSNSTHFSSNSSIPTESSPISSNSLQSNSTLSDSTQHDAILPITTESGPISSNSTESNDPTEAEGGKQTEVAEIAPSNTDTDNLQPFDKVDKKWRKCCSSGENFNFRERKCVPKKDPTYEFYDVETKPIDKNKIDIVLTMSSLIFVPEMNSNRDCQGSVIRNSSKYDMTLTSNGTLLIYNMMEETVREFKNYCVDSDSITGEISALLCDTLQVCSEKDGKPNGTIINHCTGKAKNISGLNDEWFKNSFYRRLGNYSDSNDLFEDYCLGANYTSITVCNVVMKCCAVGQMFVQKSTKNSLKYDCQPLPANVTDFQNFTFYFDGYIRSRNLWPINPFVEYTYVRRVNQTLFISEKSYKRGLCYEMVEEDGHYFALMYTNKPQSDLSFATQIFLLISIVLLLITFLVYFIVPSLSDEHGKSVGIHCLCLAISYKFSFYFSWNTWYFSIITIMIYFYFASIIWLTLLWIHIAVDIFYSFQINEVPSPLSLAKQASFGVGVFLVSVIPTVIFYMMKEHAPAFLFYQIFVGTILIVDILIFLVAYFYKLKGIMAKIYLLLIEGRNAEVESAGGAEAHKKLKELQNACRNTLSLKKSTIIITSLHFICWFIGLFLPFTPTNITFINISNSVSGGVIFIIFVLFKKPGEDIKDWITGKCCKKPTEKQEEPGAMEMEPRRQSQESLDHVSEESADEPVHQRIEETEAQIHQPGPGEATGETTITRIVGETETNDDITTSKEISISMPVMKDDVKKFEETPETMVKGLLDTAEKAIDNAIETQLTLNANADFNVSIMPSMHIEGALSGALTVQGAATNAIESPTTENSAEEPQALAKADSQ